MKNMKKILALVVAVLMIAASMSALAEDVPTGSITIKPSETVPVKTKSLSAYKILNATYNGTGERQAVAYTVPAEMVSFYDEYFSTGTGSEKQTATQLATAAGKTFDVYVVEQIAALDADKIVDFEYKALEVAATVLTAISGVVDGDNIKFDKREPGYYVIKDNDTNEPVSAVMLDTVTDANVDIVLKASDKTEKKIQTAGDLINKKANELGIGKTVEYVITQEIPNYRGYDYFYYTINDTLHSGLTFLPETVKVKVGGVELAEGTDYHLYYGETAASILNGKTFIIAFEDVVKNSKTNIGDAVEVTYNANVNSNAVVGVNPNTNEVHVEYSNDPHKDQRGDKTGFPGIPASTEDNPMGIGPSKWTDTFTTQLTVYKQDGKTQEKLNGVSFTLSGTCQDVVVYAQDVFDEDSVNGTYYRLNNGTYTQEQPRTEDQMVPVQDKSQGGWVKVTDEEAEQYVSAHKDDDGYVGPVTVSGQTYRPYIADTDSDKDVFQLLVKNDGLYESTSVKYVLVHAKGNEQQAYTDTRNGTTAGQGTITWSQLGAGTYTLTETTGLPGYNSIAPITFTIACELPDADSVKNGTETATWSVTAQKNGTVTYDAQTGTFSITIDNNKGATLPSTGGMGTTILYIGGSILVILAAVLLITKRRMNAND